MTHQFAKTAAAGAVEVVDEPDVRFRRDLQRSVEPAYRLASVILGNTSEAEDVTQDALERAWRARRSLREADRFDAWFQRIVVNACRDRVRSRRAAPVVLSMREASDGPPWPRMEGDQFAATLSQDGLRRAFLHLSVDQRAVVAMRFYLDLEVEEIARRLGTRQGTVKSRLHRALKIMRNSWEGDR